MLKKSDNRPLSIDCLLNEFDAEMLLHKRIL
jgi:hypothetical protein